MAALNEARRLETERVIQCILIEDVDKLIALRQCTVGKFLLGAASHDQTINKVQGLQPRFNNFDLFG